MDITRIQEFVKDQLQDDRTGHDIQHIKRVEQTARMIAKREGLENQLEIIVVAVWLHDSIDDKLMDNIAQPQREVQEVLEASGATDTEFAEIMDIILHQSYSDNLNKHYELSPAGQVVQDADRLDAIGAIGIARAFYYGGSKGHLIYDGESPRDFTELSASDYRKGSSVINHFHEKLLHLTDLMNTQTGRALATQRTQHMEDFLQQLLLEVRGDK